MSSALTIKPEDKTKVIALGSAVVILFGYAAFNFARSAMGSSSSPAPTPAPSATPAVTPPAAGAAPSKPLPGTAVIEEAPALDPAKAKRNSIAAQAASGAAQNHVAMPDLSLDPFLPVRSNKDNFQEDGIPRKDKSGPVTPPPMRLSPLPGKLADKNAPANATSGPTMESLLNQSGLPQPQPGGDGARPTTGQVLPMIMPDIPFLLAGIIRGEAGKGSNGAVAMISVGEGQQFVRVGELIEGWRVLHIGGDTVTLRRDKRMRVLRIGAGASQAATPYLAPIPAAPPASVSQHSAYPNSLPATTSATPADPVAMATPGGTPVELTPLLPGQP